MAREGIRPELAAEQMLPSTPAEHVNSIAHYYRGELSRMIAWRDRLDHTTNWAIAASAAMLSVSLSSPAQHHGVILCCMAIVFLLLGIESRRYRFFDVARRRVRMIEQNYYAKVFSHTSGDPHSAWLQMLSQDLIHPAYHMTAMEAMGQRLRRNYGWIYVVLLSAWWLKVSTASLNTRTGDAQFVHSIWELLDNAAVSYVPGWLVISGLVVFGGWLLYLIRLSKDSRCGTDIGGVEV